MKRVIILKGLQGSGKSTWAKEQVNKHPGQFKIISTDSLRDMLDDGRWSKQNEKFMIKCRDALILLALQEGYHVIVDAIHLHPKHLPHITELAKGLAKVEIQDFTDVPLEVCIERDLKRSRSVGEKVIRQWHRDFLAPKPPVIVANPGLPDAIIVDIDGTLALMNGRNPYDASLCENDILNEPVASIVKQYPRITLLVSGRKEEHRPQTERWLLQHGIVYYALWMRQTDDNRKDVEVKRDIYNEHIKDRYNIDFILDDRQKVVAFWRSLGLTVLQVADGDF